MNARQDLMNGPQDAINEALLGMTYRTNSGTNSDVLTVDTHDLGNAVAGGSRVDRDTVTLTRVSGFARGGRGGRGGCGEGGSSTNSIQTATKQETAANTSATDSFLSSTTLPANNPRIENSTRSVDLLASSNSGCNKSPAMTDRWFEQP